MKNLFSKIGLFFKRMGTKIASWPLAVKIAVPVVVVVIAGAGTAIGVAAHNNRLKPANAIVDSSTSESEKTSDSTSESETGTEETKVTYVPKMIVGIDVPQKQMCWVAYSSIEKDLNLYVVGMDNNRISGKDTQIKLLQESKASGLWDSIHFIDSIQGYIDQALQLESEGGSTTELEAKVRKDDKIVIDFTSEQVKTTVSFILVDDQGNEVTEEEAAANGQEIPAGKEVADLSESEKNEYDTAFQTAMSELKLSDRLKIFKATLWADYAKKLEATEGTVYTDDDKDGMYYISGLEGGRYYACFIPQDGIEPKELASLSVVKNKIEYVKVENIKQEETTDTSKEPTREESIVPDDTVEYIKTSKKDVLPEYATAKDVDVAPIIASTTNKSDTITIADAPAEGSEDDEIDQTEYEGVLEITSEIKMYPVDHSSAKDATISYVAMTNVVKNDSLAVSVIDEAGITSSTLSATLSDGKIAIHMESVPQAGTTLYVRLTGTYDTYEDSAIISKDVHVDCLITFLDATTKIKDKEGHELYLDKSHFSKDRTALTVDIYNEGTTYYYETKAEYTLYYGWQNLNGKQFYYDKNAKVVTGKQVINGSTYNFGSDGMLLISGEGVDVSKWDGTIDWKKMSTKASFAIIKCGGSDGGRYKDKYFDKNIAGIRQTSMAYGLYFYCTARTEADAVKDASLAIEYANSIGEKFALPIYCDYEDEWIKNNLSKEQSTKNILAFCKTIESAGYKAGVYSFDWMIANCIDMSQLQDYSLWIANYHGSIQYYKGKYDIWQYTSSGDPKAYGTSGSELDLNHSYFN